MRRDSVEVYEVRASLLPMIALQVLELLGLCKHVGFEGLILGEIIVFPEELVPHGFGKQFRQRDPALLIVRGLALAGGQQSDVCFPLLDCHGDLPNVLGRHRVVHALLQGSPLDSAAAMDPPEDPPPCLEAIPSLQVSENLRGILG